MIDSCSEHNFPITTYTSKVTHATSSIARFEMESFLFLFPAWYNVDEGRYNTILHTIHGLVEYILCIVMRKVSCHINEMVALKFSF